MKKVAALGLLILSLGLHAAEDQKQKDLKALVDVMEMDAMIDSMYAQMEAMMQNMDRELGVKPSEKAIFDKYHSKMFQVIHEHVSWKKMEPGVMEMYLRHFSEKEIAEMLTFYQSDTGRSIIKKMPTIMQESMLMGQSMMADAMPKIQALSRELVQELKKAREQNASAAAETP